MYCSTHGYVPCSERIAFPWECHCSFVATENSFATCHVTRTKSSFSSGILFSPVKSRAFLSFLHRISLLIIHQIFSLVGDWSKRVTWANIPHLKLGNDIPQFLKPTSRIQVSH